MQRLTVVVPTLDEPTSQWNADNITMRTLRAQTYRDFSTSVIWDRLKKGANWARNEGFKGVRTELVLFSDDDVEWKPFALEALIAALDEHPEASYAYGAYTANWRTPGRTYTIGNYPFSGQRLRRFNFVSTMSIIRTRDFPGFDETLKRYQDWDLWLTLLEMGKTGVFCGKVIFGTFLDPKGISFGSVPASEARAAIARKHKLTA